MPTKVINLETGEVEEFATLDDAVNYAERMTVLGYDWVKDRDGDIVLEHCEET